MSFIRNMSIRSKLILITLVPVLGLLYYLKEDIQGDLRIRKAAKQLILDVSDIEKLSLVVHELQKERSLSVSYLSSGGDRLGESLLIQRDLTNKAISDLRSILIEHNRAFNNLWLLDSLPMLRAKIDEGNFQQADDQLSHKGRLCILEEINDVFRISTNKEIKNRLDDHLSLLYAKDYLSQLRTTLAKASINQKFDSEAEYGKFASQKGKYEFNHQRMVKMYMPDIKAQLDQKLMAPVMEHTHFMINEVYNNPNADPFPLTFDVWYSAVTASINILKECEDISIELIRKHAGQELALANNSLIGTLIISGIIILLCIIAVALVIGNIVQAITKMRNAAELISQGFVDVSLDVHSNDEIGNLAYSFSKIINTSREFSLAADAIGRGDYDSTIRIRNGNDLLGRALESMRLNLKKLSEETLVRNWLLSGQSDLNEVMRGEKEIIQLAQDIVIQIATYLKAQIGAIYLQQNGHLSLVGSYAFNHRKGNTNLLKVGEGLVGQASLEKRAIVFSDIPSDYVKINSGLGNTSPRSILAFPFLFNSEVKSVIELGTSSEFSELDRKFLDLVGNSVAIAFNSSQARTTQKELLEETQRQSEELEAQQEELRQANEELQEKTTLLERSESTLRVQQEELYQTNKKLEEKANILEMQKEKLEQTKAEIEDNARQLETVSRYKSEFLANMSHELRTPLNSILILAQLLSENKNNTLGEKEVSFAKNIHNSGTDLLNLINEILDLSKVEAGKMELNIESFACSSIINDINNMLSEMGKNKSIDFHIELHGDITPEATISSDLQRVEQVLRNLLSNAFKFTPSGGSIRLLISRSSQQVFKNKMLQGRNDVIQFLVTDTGIGIPADKQKIIFEAFQQADGSTKRKYGGTGLGLSICRELANALGGEIDLKSEEGKGSTFTFSIPQQFSQFTIITDKKVEVKEEHEEKGLKVLEAKLAEDMPVPVTEEIIDDRATIQESDKKVLIMEDDTAFASLLLNFVRERNYKGVIAYQGNTGLSYARQYKPDAIILDMKMPVMDGAEVLRQLKNDPTLRHIPVQIISGYDRRKEGMDLGAFDYIQKPLSKEALQHAFDNIEDFINRKLKKLLIVEDNELQNNVIRELIGNGDVKCYSAYSGEQAYEMLHREKFDCTILDLGLPDMSGFDLLEKLKKDDLLSKVPTIIYTGKDLTREESNLLNKLANTVVLKTANSKERLLDETTLFLHRVESKLPKEKQNMIRKLHKTDEILRNKKVLVVDDDMRNIYSITNVLTEEGTHCLVAENGKEALEVLKQTPDIDMVLMDIMMPQIDGYEATREIRKMQGFEKLPIIALTAKAMKGDREKCLEAGMSDYISKPVNIAQLISLMRVWLYH